MGAGAYILALIISLVAVYPMWLLLPRYGVSHWWSLTCLLPGFIGGIALIILLYVIAFRDPITNTSREAA